MAENKQQNQLTTKTKGFFLQENDRSKNIVTLTQGLEEVFTELNVQLTPKQKIITASNVDKLQDYLDSKKLSLNSFSRRNLQSVLWYLIRSELDISSNEAYFESREITTNYRDENGKYIEKKTNVLSAKIQGTGNLKLLRTIGVDVKKVHNAWIIRDGDEFTFPSYDGLTITPPKWQPKFQSEKVVRVVIPVELTDGNIEWLIGDRNSCITNLLAHISNNLMGVDDEVKKSILKSLENKTLEQIINDDVRFKKEYIDYKTKKPYEKEVSAISPAWKSLHSMESMLTTKMFNNAIRRFPKELPDGLFAEGYQSSFEDYDQYKKVETGETLDYSTPEEVVEEIENNSSTQPIQSVLPTGEVVLEEQQEKPQPKKSKQEELEEEVGF